MAKQILSLFGARAVGAAVPGAVALLGRAAAVIVGYLALEWLSYLHDYKSIPVTPWNPGLGVVFGLVAVGGGLYAILLGIGVFLTDTLVLKTGTGLELSAAVALVTTAGYGLAGHVLRKRMPVNLALPRLRDVFLFLSIALGAALVTDLVIAGMLITDHRIERHDFLATFLPLFVGDAIGIAVFAPIVLRLAASLRQPQALRALWPNAMMWATALAIVLAVLALHMAYGIQGMRYLFVLFVPVVFAAVRDGMNGACFSLAAAQFSLVGMVHATGQDLPTFVDVQAQMLVLTITGLVVGAIVSERQAISAKAHDVAIRLRELEAEAAQAARVSLAEGMASALAHEINQPITAVRALARSVQHLLGSENGDIERARRNLSEMVVQVDHAAHIVRRMREFLRRGSLHISTIEISTLLHNVASLIQTAAAQRGVEIRVESDAGLPAVFGDRIRIEQVMLNLMRNALDALGESERPDALIRIGARHASGSGEIEFYVVDNGPGIADDLSRRLFDPLTSTKPNGLGLGLAISASIVQSHRGRIWLAAHEPGHTEFRFALPIDAGSE